tara:strand:+ start:445 stop:678 length:234 start_codon:yes stop_codon:yes gene_type:complete
VHLCRDPVETVYLFFVTLGSDFCFDIERKITITNVMRQVSSGGADFQEKQSGFCIEPVTSAFKEWARRLENRVMSWS